MYKRLVGSLLSVMMLMTLAVGSATGVAADTQYTCPDSTCSFSVPDYYNEINKDSTSITFKDPNSGGVFAVVLVDFPGLATLDDAGTLLVQQLSQATGYQADAAGVKTTTISGVPARSFAYLSTNDSGTQVETAVYFAVYKSKLYALTFATTPDQEDAFVQSAQGVFDSWQFT